MTYFKGKAGTRASDRNRLRQNTAAALDVSDMCETITMTPTLVKL
jgi:hypothetical protein